MAGQRNSSARRGVWGEVVRKADRQHGVVSRNQLRALGLSEAAIDHAVATARLHPLFRGTFAVGRRRVGRSGWLLAATLACGEGSVLSHGTAATHLGLWKRPQSRLIDVVAPVEAGRKIPGVRRRFTPPPLPREIHAHDGVPCITPARVIVDVAGSGSERTLRGTIEQASVNGMLDIPAIDAVLDGPRRRHARRLLRVLEPWRGYSSRTKVRSLFEGKLMPLLVEYALPIPDVNKTRRIGGEYFELDFAWPQQRFAIETDGGQFHDNPEAAARDSHRNQILADAGWRLWRVRWEELRDHPDATIADLARRLRTSPPAR